jgi:hypothetical protein
MYTEVFGLAAATWLISESCAPGSAIEVLSWSSLAVLRSVPA